MNNEEMKLTRLEELKVAETQAEFEFNVELFKKTRENEFLQYKIEKHQLWIESNCKDGMPGIFMGDDLRRKLWVGGTLRGADLQDADLRHGYFGDSSDTFDMSKADFRGANLGGLDLHNIICEDSDFRCASLRGVSFFGGQLTDTDFRGADLTGATFKGVDLSLTDFRGANLTGVIFIECGNLEHALFDDDYVVKR